MELSDLDLGQPVKELLPKGCICSVYLLEEAAEVISGGIKKKNERNKIGKWEKSASAERLVQEKSPNLEFRKSGFTQRT